MGKTNIEMIVKLCPKGKDRNMHRLSLIQEKRNFSGVVGMEKSPERRRHLSRNLKRKRNFPDSGVGTYIYEECINGHSDGFRMRRNKLSKNMGN